MSTKSNLTSVCYSIFKLFFLLVLFSINVTISIANAADHEDGPDVRDFPFADIVDLFSFTDQLNEKLVLIMTVNHSKKHGMHFSTNLAYRFRLRPLDVSLTSDKQFNFDVSDEEIKVECKFPNQEPENTPLCIFTDQKSSLKDLSVFAGLVQDPFFSNVFRARKVRPSDTQARFFPPNVNPFKKRSVLGLTVEIPLSLLPKRTFAVVAETVALNTIDERKGEQRIDRIGNVEVTNFMLCFRPIEKAKITIPLFGKIGPNLPLFRAVKYTCSKEQEKYIKNWYHAEDAFKISPDHIEHYQRFFKKGLLLLDQMDSSKEHDLDWNYNIGSEHPFIQHFTNADFLIVDVTKPCVDGMHSYLDIQMSTYFSKDSKTCGGRMPNDDVIDILQTLMINGPHRLPGWWGQASNGVVRSDGIDVAGKKAPNHFPWLYEIK